MNPAKPKHIFGAFILVCVLLLFLSQHCYCQEISKVIIPRFDKGRFVSSNQYLLSRLMESLAIGGKLEVEGPELARYELEKSGDSPPLTYQWEDILDVGRKLDGDLVLWGEVEKREIKIKCGFSVPYILTKYSHQAEIKVSLRLFDLQKGQMVLSKSFEAVASGEKGMAWFIHPERKPEKDLSVLQEEKLLKSAEDKVVADMSKVILKLLKKKG